MRKFFYRVSLWTRWIFKVLDILRNIFTNQRAEYIILEYHSVGAGADIELDITAEVFERQMRYLNENCLTISLEEFLEDRKPNLIQRPLVVLTFDDGYENFYSIVFPILKKYNLPATLFPALNFVDNENKIPIKSSIGDWKEFKPLTKENLETMARCPLITLSSHGYGHLNFSEITPNEAIEDLTKSQNWFQEKLGISPDVFAYPRGLICEANSSLIKDFFRYAVLADYNFGIKQFDPYRMNRIPILRTDKFLWFKFKVNGILFREQGLFKWFIKVLDL